MGPLSKLCAMETTFILLTLIFVFNIGHEEVYFIYPAGKLHGHSGIHVVGRNTTKKTQHYQKLQIKNVKVTKVHNKVTIYFVKPRQMCCFNQLPKFLTSSF